MTTTRRRMAPGLLLLALPACMRAASSAAAPTVAAPDDLPPLRQTFRDDFETFRAAPDGRDPRSGARIWRTTYFWGGRTLQATSKDGQWYVDETIGVNPFTHTHGLLEIAARPAAETGSALRPGLTHTSGLITTKETFTQLYGFFEMRAQLPAVRGFWPAFWMTPEDLSWPPEIDVMEMLGHEPRRIYTTVHTEAGGRRRAIGREVAVPDTSAGFNNFAVSWRPDLLRWFVNGREVFRTPTPADAHKPMYMLANLAVGGPGSWPGLPDATARGTLRIAHLRAWQFTDLARG